VPENHLVRVVSATVDKIELKALFKAYSTGGGNVKNVHPCTFLTASFALRQNIASV